MGKIAVGCCIGIIFGFMLGVLVAEDITIKMVKDHTGYTWSEFGTLKSDCEASLPRDKFCKLEIKAVEE